MAQIDDSALQAEVTRFKNGFDRIRAEVGKVIVGQDRVIEAVLTAVITQQDIGLVT